MSLILCRWRTVALRYEAGSARSNLAREVSRGTYTSGGCHAPGRVHPVIFFALLSIPSIYLICTHRSDGHGQSRHALILIGNLAMDHRESQIDVVEDDKKYVVTEGLDEVERQGDIPPPETIRALKGRQMSMIAIGGAIGELGPRWWLAI